MTTTKATHQCPDCTHPPYPTAKGLATHRRFAHGVAGISRSAVSERKRRKKAGKAAAAITAPAPVPEADLKCQHCPFVAKWIGGLKNHMRRHKDITQPGKPGKEKQLAKRTTQTITIQAHQEGQSNSDGIPDALIAVASGRFIELCRSMAFEYDLPSRLFAARVAAFVYGTQVR